jgi:hypothetical protein
MGQEECKKQSTSATGGGLRIGKSYGDKSDTADLDVDEETTAVQVAVSVHSLFCLGDVLNNVLEFIDTPSLAQFDGCCKISSRKSIRIWAERSNSAQQISTVSFARAELDSLRIHDDDGDTAATPKQQVILYERLRLFCHKMELVRLESEKKQRSLSGTSDTKDSTNNQTQATTRLSRRRRAAQPKDSTLTICQHFDPQVFREPEAFLFYARMTNRTETVTTATARQGRGNCSLSSSSRHEVNSTETVVHWEGLVSALDQGGWGSSSILFFHLRELGNKLQWTPSMEQVLRYQHKQTDPVENQKYQAIVKRAFENFSLVMVAFPKEGHPQSSSSKPRLVVATKGVHFVSHYNRLYFHIPSKQYVYQQSPPLPSSAQDASDDDCQSLSSSTPSPSHTVVSSSWVYPRLVTSEAVDDDSPGELFGVRLVCNQAGGGESLVSILR